MYIYLKIIKQQFLYKISDFEVALLQLSNVNV